MNYGKKLTTVLQDELKQGFNEENKEFNITWDVMYEKIKKMIKELFICVKMKAANMHYEKVERFERLYTRKRGEQCMELM